MADRPPAGDYNALDVAPEAGQRPMPRRPVPKEEPCFDWNCFCTTFLMMLVMGVTALGIYTYMQGWGWWEDYIYGFRNNDLVHAVTDINDYHLTIDVTELVVILFHRQNCMFTAEVTPILEDMGMRHKGLASFLTVDLENVDISRSDYAYSVRQLPTFVIMCHGSVLGDIPAQNFDHLEDSILKTERWCETQKLQLPGVFGGS
uniref:Thioredoxin domain-containing protein n=1 Tax=Lotharella globosa TaxID=91324 RepID=A0A7S4DP76_9EUKA